MGKGRLCYLYSCDALWTAGNIIDDSIRAVREQVRREEVLLGLSGGVDSSVVAALLHKAIGDSLPASSSIPGCCGTAKAIR